MIAVSWEREALIALNLSGARRRTVTTDTPVVLVPTELMITAWRSLFPAERMCVFGGRAIRRGTRVTCAMDVTEARPTVVHVPVLPGAVDDRAPRSRAERGALEPVDALPPRQRAGRDPSL